MRKQLDQERRKVIENIYKGVANHRRLQILEHLLDHPNASVFDIAEELEIDFRTVSQHVRRLAQSGLVEKKYEGRTVRSVLTPLGKHILTFSRMLE